MLMPICYCEDLLLSSDVKCCTSMFKFYRTLMYWSSMLFDNNVTSMKKNENCIQQWLKEVTKFARM